MKVLFQEFQGTPTLSDKEIIEAHKITYSCFDSISSDLFLATFVDYLDDQNGNCVMLGLPSLKQVDVVEVVELDRDVDGRL